MFVVTINRKQRRWLIMAVGLFLLVAVGRLVAVPGGPLPAAGRYHPLRKGDTGTNEVALTFNLYWGEEVSTGILDLLFDEEVSATFFVTGPWAEAHPDLLSRIVDEGHELGNGGYNYVNLSEYGREYIRDQIHRGGSILEELSGQRPAYFRPPNGSYNDDVAGLAMDLGYTVVLWSVDAHDWMNPGVEHVVRQVLDNAGPGDIILMHANDPPGDVIPALEEIIAGFKEAERPLVTLKQLLSPAE